MFREDGSQEQNIELGLVVSQDDHWSLAVEKLRTIVENDEADADGAGTDDVEGARGRVLAIFVVEVEGAERGGGEGAVGRADDERGVGGEAAVEEAEDGYMREEEVQGEEGEGDGGVDEGYEERVVDQEMHCDENSSRIAISSAMQR